MCLKPFDDYSRQIRCYKCRVLLLLCDSCGDKNIFKNNNDDDPYDEENKSKYEIFLKSLICEQCIK
jgi:hypothetical protein